MNILLKTIVALMLFGHLAAAVEAGPKQKPQAPAQISITPQQQGSEGQDISPGDVVVLTISAEGFLDIDELQIETFLQGGAEYVSGERTWKGRAVRNERKVITLSVRSPLQGAGKVRARVSLFRAGERLLTKQTLFDLGPKSGSSPNKPVRPSRKDSKGREIVNY